MIEFGKTLREAREAKGYSVSQLSEMTRILPQIVESLEREDFSRIVAPIYGRGFVKLYCECVGIDAQPLIEAFMEIYTGKRPPVIRMRESEVSAPIVEPPAPIAAPPTAEEPPPIPEPPPVVAAPFVPGQNDLPFPDGQVPPRRDYRLPGHSMQDVPRSFWRFGVLAVIAVALVVLLVLGGRALYRATMRVPVGRETSTQAETSAKPATPRTPMNVPPLYID